MKQTGKRVLSILLMMLFLCSLAAIGMMSASAEVWVTRDAAIAWVKAQADAGVKYDIDGMYLCQCSDFASAYINYLRNGNPFTGISTYNGYQYKDISYPSDWQKIANTPTLIPEPGDILVFNGTSLNPNGHVSVALEGCTTTVCRSVEQSGATPNKGAYYAVGGYSDSYNIFWGVVRPKFKNATPPAKPTMSANKTVVPIGDTVTFTFNAAGATNYTIGIDRQNPEGAWSRVITQAVTSGCSFTLDGSYYSAYVTASNGAGGADSDKVYFNVGVGGRSVSGDFNGDGKTDYATLFDYGNGRMKIHVFLSTGTKFSEEIWYESMTPGWYPLDKVSGRVVAGDFNGDGLCDVAAMYDYGTTPENGQKSQWHVWLSTGSSFQKWQAWHTQTQYPLNNMTDKVVAGDFNGDGKDDIAAIYYYNWSGMNEVRAHVWLSTGEKLNGAYTWATNTQYGGFNINGRVVAGDFNGDGKDDIAAMYDYGNAECRFHVWQSTGNAFTGWTSWRYGTQFHASNVTGRMVAGDFNGDGLCDIAAMYDYGSNTARMFVWLSTGSSFPLSANWWEAMTIGSYAPSNATGRMVAGDFNGDGLCDIAAMYDYDRSYSTFHMFMSDKTKFTNPWWNRVNGYNARRTTGFVGCTDNYTEKFSLVKLAKYTISYNANDGTGAPAAQTKWQDVALTLSSTRPTRSGYTFLGWSTSSTATTATYQPGGSYTANANVTLSAVWQIIPPTTYVLTVQNGSGSGSYEAGTRITITANAAPTGKVFDEWTTPVGGIENSNFATATFIMPALSTTVTATYKDVPVSTYTLTVNQGTGSGSYEAGTAVNIKADQPPAGKHFVKWTATAGTLADENSASTTFTMPAGDATVTATYEGYYLTVNSGYGSGRYLSGTAVTISPLAAPEGQRFKEWNISPPVTFIDGTSATSAIAKFTMPAQDVTVTAVYEDIPIETTQPTTTNPTTTTTSPTTTTAPTTTTTQVTTTMPATTTTALATTTTNQTTTTTQPPTSTTTTTKPTTTSTTTTTTAPTTTTTAPTTTPTTTTTAVTTTTPPTPPIKYIFSTKYEATFLNWILFFVCFGWLWMWF